MPAPMAEGVAPKTLLDDLRQDVEEVIDHLAARCGLILVIGCLNVANLMVARSAARQREIAPAQRAGGSEAVLSAGKKSSRYSPEIALPDGYYFQRSTVYLSPTTPLG
jgi:hypothetical protein